MQVDHTAVAADQHDERDRFHAALFGERFGIDDGLPRQRLHGEEAVEVVALLVEIDADDFKTFLAELVVVPFDVRNFLLAGTAPSGPEIDEHELAGVRFPVERFAIESVAEDDQRFADEIGPLAARGDHRLGLLGDVGIGVVFEAGFQLGVDLAGQLIPPCVFELLGEEGQFLQHAFARLASYELIDGGEQLFHGHRLVFGDRVGSFIDAAFQEHAKFAEPFEGGEDAFVFRVFERRIDGRHRGEADFDTGRLLQGDSGAGDGIEQFHIARGPFQGGIDRVHYRLRFAGGAGQQLGHRHFQLRDVAHLLQGG